jgi:drug/metabolite transporter (DMT)-like permease
MTIEPDDHQGARAGTRAAGALSRLNRNPFLLLALAALFWAGNHIVGRAISDQVPPIGISTVRWLIPALLLWPLARPHLQRDWPLIRARWRVMLWLGVTAAPCSAPCNISACNIPAP